VHETQGPERDRTIQRYRFLGASLDGRNVGVIFSHFGPSSMSPFATVAIYTTGETVTGYSLSEFSLDIGTEESLKAVEEDTIANSADALEMYGIELGKNAPTAVPWCVSDDSVFVDAAEAFSASFGVDTEPCPLDRTATVEAWSLCRADQPAACAHMITLGLDGATCSEGDVALLDVHRAADVLWVIAERKVFGMIPDYLMVREAAGMALRRE
jgi:hypothetical protein